jgi:capsule polysaccharide export protein KpsE/RkpR
LNPEVANHDVLKNHEEQAPGGRYAAEEVNGSSPFLVDGESGRAADLLLAIWRERRFVAKALLYGLMLAAVVSVLIPPKYESVTRMMPPQKSGGLGGLAAMLASAGEEKAGAAGPVVGSIISDAMGVKSSGALYIGVLRSSSVEDSLINRFDLRKVYRVRYSKDAREELSNNTDISEDRKSGIISISVTDRSPQRAQQMADAYVSTLDELMAQLDTSAAHRERVFLETRLKQVKQDLDSTSKELSEFSSKNVTLDVKEQGKALVEGGVALEGQLIATESQLDGLKQIYTENNVRVRSLQARVDLLRQKLSQIRGSDVELPGANGNGGDDFGVSISKLPILGLTFYDLYRRQRIQETVFEVLTKQYELAKIEEAKELPTTKVLDPAKLPEVKSSPKRTLITLVGGFLAAFLAVCFVATRWQLSTMSSNGALGFVGLEMREGLGEDLAFLRSHSPEWVQRVASRVRLWVARRTKRRSRTSD